MQDELALCVHPRHGNVVMVIFLTHVEMTKQLRKATTRLIMLGGLAKLTGLCRCHSKPCSGDGCEKCRPFKQVLWGQALLLVSAAMWATSTVGYCLQSTRWQKQPHRGQLMTVIGSDLGQELLWQLVQATHGTVPCSNGALSHINETTIAP